MLQKVRTESLEILISHVPVQIDVEDLKHKDHVLSELEMFVQLYNAIFVLRVVLVEGLEDLDLDCGVV